MYEGKGGVCFDEGRGTEWIQTLDHRLPDMCAPLQVPPPLAAALGRELRKALEKKAEAERARALAA